MRLGIFLLSNSMLLAVVLSVESDNSGFGDIESIDQKETSSEKQPGIFHSSKTIDKYFILIDPLILLGLFIFYLLIIVVSEFNGEEDDSLYDDNEEEDYYYDDARAGTRIFNVFAMKI